MCGINGIMGLNAIEGKQKLALMNSALAHRGPNDEGTFAEGKIALGHRRLSIIDLSAAGHQPMIFQDRYIIIYNGELYNFKEIKNELKEFSFKTNSDTEVILAAYAKWGVNCLNHFNGMYAFAIWDKLTQELFIARDRLGIKPLYYYQRNNLLLFSSEIRSLLKSDLIPRKLDQTSLIDYLRYQTVHAPSTIIKDVRMLMPGHYMILSGDQLSVKPVNYWDVSKKCDDSVKEKTYNEVCSDINDLLLKAVERRLIADVPFGAFLSGGIDSSAIVGLMSKVAKEKIKTFCITFNEEEFSEAKYAKLIADKFKTDHHDIRLNPQDLMNELPSALQAMDHPSGDGPNTYVVSRATKNAGITMALSGLGGDELFAGYDIFTRSLELENYKWISSSPLIIRKTLGSMAKKMKPGIASEKVAEIFKTDFNFTSTYPISRQVLLDEKIKTILKEKSLSSNVVEEIVKNQQKFWNNKNYRLSRVSIAEISTYMQNVLLRDTDQMSMAHALEVRVPFLDYKLVEYVLSVPDKYKYPHRPKKLLIDSLGDLLPDEIVNRPKMGFTFPWKHWMKNELKQFCEQRIESLSQRKEFDKAGVNHLWQSFLKEDKNITWARVWYLIVLENWLTENQID